MFMDERLALKNPVLRHYDICGVHDIEPWLRYSQLQ
jgi:hypothetical protein